VASFGAIATAGEWGLKHGCAVAYTDKGTGNGAPEPTTNMVNDLRGVRTPAHPPGHKSQVRAYLSPTDPAAYRALTRSVQYLWQRQEEFWVLGSRRLPFELRTTFRRLQWTAAAKEALRLDPSDADLHMQLGKMYLAELHYPDVALAHFQNAQEALRRQKPVPGGEKDLARHLRAVAPRPDSVVASDARRAQQTARIVAAELGLDDALRTEPAILPPTPRFTPLDEPVTSPDTSVLMTRPTPTVARIARLRSNWATIPGRS